MTLTLKGVSKSFGGLRAVSNVSFTVPDRSIFGLIGPNGAGKTTVFNLITGVYKHDAGSIHFGPTDLAPLKPARIAAAVPDNLAGGRRVDAADQVEHRGLAGAVRPDQREDLAAADVEADLVDRQHAAEAHAQVGGRKQDVGGRHLRRSDLVKDFWRLNSPRR